MKLNIMPLERVCVLSCDINCFFGTLRRQKMSKLSFATLFVMLFSVACAPTSDKKSSIRSKKRSTADVVAASLNLNTCSIKSTIEVVGLICQVFDHRETSKKAANKLKKSSILNQDEVTIDNQKVSCSNTGEHNVVKHGQALEDSNSEILYAKNGTFYEVIFETNEEVTPIQRRVIVEQYKMESNGLRNLIVAKAMDLESLTAKKSLNLKDQKNKVEINCYYQLKNDQEILSGKGVTATEEGLQSESADEGSSNKSSDKSEEGEVVSQDESELASVGVKVIKNED